MRGGKCSSFLTGCVLEMGPRALKEIYTENQSQKMHFLMFFF